MPTRSHFPPDSIMIPRINKTMEGLRPGKQPYHYTQVSDGDSDSDDVPACPPCEQVPDLFGYFSEFPNINPEARVRIARTYASAVCAQLGIGGRKKRKTGAPPNTPPTVPEE